MIQNYTAEAKGGRPPVRLPQQSRRSDTRTESDGEQKSESPFERMLGLIYTRTLVRRSNMKWLATLLLGIALMLLDPTLARAG